MYRWITSPLLILSLISCGKSEAEAAPTPSGPDADGYTQVQLNSSITHVQPMTGIVIWNDNSHRKDDYVQMEFAYMLYSDVCKQKDVFDWSPMDKLLESAASRGHQVVVRFRYTYVGKKCAVPDYIKALPEYEETVGKSEGRDTYFPDWRCEELQRFHMEFHRRFAERYDNDPRLAFVETGFGLWAEYHIYDGPMILGKTFPSYDFQDRFLRAMDEWFEDTPWMISVDAADDTYAPFQDRRELLDLKFGNFDDSFMCEEYDKYNIKNWSFFGRERYKTAPLGGEFSYYTDYDQKHCLDPEGIHGRTFESMVAKVHMTFIIGNDQPGYQKAGRIAEAAMSMGYRFQIKEYKIKTGTGAAVLISNVGVAPIYRDAWVAVDGLRGDYNLRGLMPDEEVWIYIDDPKISADVRPAIECDHLVPGQKGIEYETAAKCPLHTTNR